MFRIESNPVREFVRQAVYGAGELVAGIAGLGYSAWAAALLPELKCVSQIAAADAVILLAIACFRLQIAVALYNHEPNERTIIS